MPGGTGDTRETTLAERAYRVIRDRILRADYPLGAEIRRRELAVELGMSTVPINDALARLESEYLIENIPRVGTRVRIPTPADIRGFWAVREGLEAQAARLFARNAGEPERRELQRAGAELDRLHESSTNVPQPDPEVLLRWRLEHMAFHLRIAEGTRIPFLVHAIEKNQILVFNWFYDHRISAARALPPHWHENLAKSLSPGSEADADTAMREHLRNRLEELLQRLEEHLTLSPEHLATLMQMKK